MAIPLSDFQRPRFIRYEEGPTLTRNEADRYMNYDNPRHYRVNIQGGYNPAEQSTSIRNIALNTDSWVGRRR